MTAAGDSSSLSRSSRTLNTLFPDGVGVVGNSFTYQLLSLPSLPSATIAIFSTINYYGKYFSSIFYYYLDEVH